MSKRSLFRGLGILLLFSSASLLSARTRPSYGGHIQLRLNDCAEVGPRVDTYAGQIWTALLFEPFFQRTAGGLPRTALFARVRSEQQGLRWILDLRHGLCFSNGSPVEIRHIVHSLRQFFSVDRPVARQVASLLSGMNEEPRSLTLVFRQPVEQLPLLLCDPALVLTGEEHEATSGPFMIDSRRPGLSVDLKANAHCPSGRPYLAGIQILLTDEHVPDVFLSAPEDRARDGYEKKAVGIRQNIYLCFPRRDQPGANTRLALYHTFLNGLRQKSRLPDPPGWLGGEPLNDYADPAQSPVSLTFPSMDARRRKLVLRGGSLRVAIPSDLAGWGEGLPALDAGEHLGLEWVGFSAGSIDTILSSNVTPVLIQARVFNEATPWGDKLVDVAANLSYEWFDTSYHALVQQYRELSGSAPQSMVEEVLIRLVTQMGKDNFLYPLWTRSYAVQYRSQLRGVVLDAQGCLRLETAWLKP